VATVTFRLATGVRRRRAGVARTAVVSFCGKIRRRSGRKRRRRRRRRRMPARRERKKTTIEQNGEEEENNGLGKQGV